jgi:hypothetical protein
VSLFTGRATLAVAVLALLLAVAFPLATYTTSLACFGLIHVGSEFRYVDRRFGRRLALGSMAAIGVLLVGVATVRALGVAQVASRAVLGPVELVLVIGLAASVLPMLRGRRLALGLAVAAGVTAGVLISPVHTIVVFAILHNATPLGFFAEAAAPTEKRRVVLTGAVIYFVIPLIIATGLPGMLLAPDADAAIFPVGPLTDHLQAYLPPSAVGASWATAAFSACVFGQLMHYWATIVVMPRLAGDRPLLPWPRGVAWLAALVVPAALLVILFAERFAFARSVYGVAAGVHAWVEVPLLLLSW